MSHSSGYKYSYSPQIFQCYYGIGGNIEGSPVYSQTDAENSNVAIDCPIGNDGDGLCTDIVVEEEAVEETPEEAQEEEAQEEEETQEEESTEEAQEEGEAPEEVERAK